MQSTCFLHVGEGEKALTSSKSRLRSDGSFFFSSSTKRNHGEKRERERLRCFGGSCKQFQKRQNIGGEFMAGVKRPDMNRLKGRGVYKRKTTNKCVGFVSKRVDTIVALSF